MMNSNPQSTSQDPGTTQRLWQPISDLGDAHTAAFRDLQRAVGAGDEVAMKKAFDAIMEIERKQADAHRAVREYELAKVRGRNL